MLCKGDKVDVITGFPLVSGKFGGSGVEDMACKDGFWG